ncbi:ATP-binding protein [Pigmentiphaga sp. H8]|uniref:AlbA family DNA-binding domain-containing protein n=1 Tax=Pigmentiphaga sp. H8 TaxID=2488560 RepID=UPI000F5950C2|nr:ATP-binding protein [Pigmentiphaga sp. H8]AZG10820.1 ATP-binding protein [Pigmentiphaga sp. H8]
MESEMPTADELRVLIESASETLNTEFKSWIDPSEPSGQDKIVRTCMALRNQNGGTLIIGIDDMTKRPAPYPAGWDADSVRAKFNADAVSALVNRYASAPFEVTVDFVEVDGVLCTGLSVSSGVQFPVAAKKQLSNSGGGTLIAIGDVFVRTLSSSHVVGTSKAGWNDWRDLFDRCFDNREADIGRFVRRHLTSIDLSALAPLLASAKPTPAVDYRKQLIELLEKGAKRFAALIDERGIDITNHGWWDTALIIEGERAKEWHSTTEFLRLIESQNPDYTGWPVWVVPLVSPHRPHVVNNRYEGLYGGFGQGDASDFMIYDPTGQFFQRRALQEDRAPDRVKPGTIFDFALPIIRCAEAIAVGLAFAKAMQYRRENTKLHFAFQWSGLRGRELTAWANPWRFLPPGGTAIDDVHMTQLTVPIDTALESIGPTLVGPLGGLFSTFDGAQINSDVFESEVRDLFNRSLKG